MTLRLTDTHCHLNLIDADQIDAVLERAWDAGIEDILVPGFDLPSSKLAIHLAEKDARIYAAVGIHPNHWADFTDEVFSEIRELAQHPCVAAIGEVGLDFYRNPDASEKQTEILKLHLALAQDLVKPLSVHIRDAWDTCWALLLDWQKGLSATDSPLALRPGVLHSFDGTPDQAVKAQGAHFRLGISGPVTYKSGTDKQDTVRIVRPDILLVETDAPYLAPHPYRGKMNEPAYTKPIVEKIAELRGSTAHQIAELTAENARSLFAWGLN